MIGQEIHDLAKRLWHIDRSITGEGVRESLRVLKDLIPPLKIKQLKTGTKVFDWEIPKEWKIKRAYIICPNGEKICEFSKNNLHLVGYSQPFRGTLSLNQLDKHLHSLPDQPDAIPYITSYYKERWGFCISHNQRKTLVEGDYKILIDSNLIDGVLNYGEILIPGKSKKEIFLSSYICHPSMANNELSGPTVLTFICKWLLENKSNFYSYRIVFIPETIGAIAYLSLNLNEMKSRVTAGYNISCVGDDRAYSFLPSRNGMTLSDKVARHVLQHTDKSFVTYKWTDRGSDERQYCAPGIDLPVASIMRTKYGEYPEYHTSLDDLECVVTPRGLDGGYWALRRAITLLESNFIYKVTNLCEPNMGRRGLYPTLSTKESNINVRTMMNFLTYCDGQHDLLSIANILEVPAWNLYKIAATLEMHNLIARMPLD